MVEFSTENRVKTSSWSFATIILHVYGAKLWSKMIELCFPLFSSKYIFNWIDKLNFDICYLSFVFFIFYALYWLLMLSSLTTFIELCIFLISFIYIDNFNNILVPWCCLPQFFVTLSSMSVTLLSLVVIISLLCYNLRCFAFIIKLIYMFWKLPIVFRFFILCVPSFYQLFWSVLSISDFLASLFLVINFHGYYLFIFSYLSFFLIFFSGF